MLRGAVVVHIVAANDSKGRENDGDSSSHYGCDESMQMFLESDVHRLVDPNPFIRLESPNYTCMHGCVDAPEVYVALAELRMPCLIGKQ